MHELDFQSRRGQSETVFAQMLESIATRFVVPGVIDRFVRRRVLVME